MSILDICDSIGEIVSYSKNKIYPTIFLKEKERIY